MPAAPVPGPRRLAGAWAAAARGRRRPGENTSPGDGACGTPEARCKALMPSVAGYEADRRLRALVSRRSATLSEYRLRASGASSNPEPKILVFLRFGPIHGRAGDVRGFLDTPQVAC